MRFTTGLLAAMALAARVPVAAAVDCPAAVTSAIEKAHPKSKTLSCDGEKENGSIVYEVNIRTENGKKLEIDVSPEGEILVTEESIALSGVPAPALKALAAKFADAKISYAERLIAPDGGISLELTFDSGGQEHEITVTEAGRILSVDDDDADGENDD